MLFYTTITQGTLQVYSEPCRVSLKPNPYLNPVFHVLFRASSLVNVPDDSYRIVHGKRTLLAEEQHRHVVMQGRVHHQLIVLKHIHFNNPKPASSGTINVHSSTNTHEKEREKR